MGRLKRNSDTVITVYAILVIGILLLMLLTAKLGGWDPVVDHAAKVGHNSKRILARDWDLLRERVAGILQR